eukprot:m.239028 g.239028  ORF g.239028 m.239028 type:complete len:672 (+) comp15289_c0_seq4:510-2525(+)
MTLQRRRKRRAPTTGAKPTRGHDTIQTNATSSDDSVDTTSATGADAHPPEAKRPPRRSPRGHPTQSQARPVRKAAVRMSAAAAPAAAVVVAVPSTGQTHASGEPSTKQKKMQPKRNRCRQRRRGPHMQAAKSQPQNQKHHPEGSARAAPKAPKSPRPRKQDGGKRATRPRQAQSAREGNQLPMFVHGSQPCDTSVKTVFMNFYALPDTGVPTLPAYTSPPAVCVDRRVAQKASNLHHLHRILLSQTPLALSASHMSRLQPNDKHASLETAPDSQHARGESQHTNTSHIHSQEHELDHGQGQHDGEPPSRSQLQLPPYTPETAALHTAIQHIRTYLRHFTHHRRMRSDARLDSPFDDTRLVMLQREWIDGKSVLDIGCNTGSLCFQLATLFKPYAVRGIDCDSTLIRQCNSRLEREVSTRSRSFPASCTLTHAPLIGLGSTAAHPAPDLVQEEKKIKTKLTEFFQDLEAFESHTHTRSSSPVHTGLPQASPTPPVRRQSSSALMRSAITEFPHNICFQQHDIAEGAPISAYPTNQYDLILCLKVAMHVHLCYGDVGIRRLFDLSSRMLRPGGRFVLQFSLWPSYQQLRDKLPLYKFHARRITLRPSSFPRYLVTHCGLELESQHTVVEGRKGLQTVVCIFTKPDLETTAVGIEGAVPQWHNSPVSAAAAEPE